MVNSIGKISDMFRQRLIAEKEIRVRDADIFRMRGQLEIKRADISSTILSAAVLVTNLSREVQIQDIDRIFLED